MDFRSFYPIIIITGIMILFIVLRSVNLWYWKIEEHLSNQKKIIDLLEKLNNKKNE